MPAAIALAGAGFSLLLLERWRPAAVAAAVALGFGLAQAWIAGFPGFPPADATDSVLWLAPLGILGAAWPAEARRSAPLVRAAIAAVVVWATLWPLAGTYRWDAAAGALWCGGTAGALFLLGPDRRRAEEGGAPAALAVVAAWTGVCSLLAHSAKLARLSLALAAALGGATLVLLALPGLRGPARGATSAGAPALGALLVLAHHYAELAWTPTLLLAAGWASLWLPSPLPSRGPRAAILARAGLAALPGAPAVAAA
ncbi:MAG: hypothetical protein AB1726_01185 [Planctomycetota bacterium]